MKHAEGLIDSIPIFLYIPEGIEEYREGIRCTGMLLDTEGYLFMFDTSLLLTFENSGVNADISLLFLPQLREIGADKYMGVISERKLLKANSPDPVSSDQLSACALELTAEFCARYKIGVGSILSVDIEE